MITKSEQEMTNQRVVGELDEIVLNILRFLDANEVLKCSLVCKRWRRIANDNSLWQNLVLNRWLSQRAVLGQVSTLALHWQKLYRYFWDGFCEKNVWNNSIKLIEIYLFYDYKYFYIRSKLAWRKLQLAEDLTQIRAVLQVMSISDK